jgi:serine/threonine protein kinase
VQLVRRLGREVWLAQHPVHGDVVFKRTGADEIRLTMLAGVPVLETGADYMVIERIEGTPLDVRVRRHGRLLVRDALTTARSIARTLADLHVQGIAHRDVKPENVVGVTLIDFGSAAMIGTYAPIAMTRAYSAPEQADPHTMIDARADVYAFGATLFAMLVGRTFTGVPLRDVLAGCSPDLDALVMRCLARDPALRFGSGGELFAALVRIVDHDATPRVTPSLPHATTTLSGSALAFEANTERSSPALVGIVTVVAMLLSIATGLRIAEHAAPPSLVASMSDFTPAAQPIASTPTPLSAIGACYR